MRDEGNLTDSKESLTPHERAVLYMLQRVRLDANLRHYMLHTEAFALLCEAEALRIGTTAEAVVGVYSEPAPHCATDIAEVVKLRRKKDLEEGLESPHSERLNIGGIAGDPPAWLAESVS